MQSSVATERCHQSEGISSQTYGIDKRSGVGRLLIRQISKFQSDNLAGEIQFCLTLNFSITGQRKPQHLQLISRGWIWTGRKMGVRKGVSRFCLLTPRDRFMAWSVAILVSIPISVQP